MKRRRHTPEQVIRKLREANRLLAEGNDIPAVCNTLEVSGQTYHRWLATYGGMKAEEVERLKELENVALKAIAKELSEPGPEASGGLRAAGAPLTLRAPGASDRRPAPLAPAPRAPPPRPARRP